MANSTSEVIENTISEQKKYTEKIIDEKIAAALNDVQFNGTLVLGTSDNGMTNAIWIDYES